MKKLINKNKFLVVTLVLLTVLVISAIISLGVRLGSSQSYTSLNSNAYVVGSLDASGEFQKDPTTFVTEDFIEVDGLQVSVKEDAEVSYKLYFFNEDKEFISATNSWGVDYNSTIPEDAEFFKISISHETDLDISLADIINYSSQVNVKFYK